MTATQAAGWTGLQSRFVVVAGVGRKGQVGEAVALELAQQGAIPILVDRQEAVAAERAAELAARGFPAHPLGCDLADQAAVVGLAERVAQLAEGEIAALVHVAGGFVPGAPVAELELEVWQHLFEINLITAFLTTRALLPSLRRARGSIVYFSAAAALPGARVSNLAAYAGTKSALLTLMRAVAAEERRYGVRANALAPTSIRTAANLATMEADVRYVEREAVARWVAWLCSPASEPVSGQAIRLD
jgi:3-oxoacyl-[acyl-carrier protein] reductase